MEIEIEVEVWNNVLNTNVPYHITITKDDIDRIAMEKARSEFDLDTPITQVVTKRQLTKLVIK